MHSIINFLKRLLHRIGFGKRGQISDKEMLAKEAAEFTLHKYGEALRRLAST